MSLVWIPQESLWISLHSSKWVCWWLAYVRKNTNIRGWGRSDFCTTVTTRSRRDEETWELPLVWAAKTHPVDSQGFGHVRPYESTWEHSVFAPPLHLTKEQVWHKVWTGVRSPGLIHRRSSGVHVWKGLLDSHLLRFGTNINDLPRMFDKHLYKRSSRIDCFKWFQRFQEYYSRVHQWSPSDWQNPTL